MTSTDAANLHISPLSTELDKYDDFTPELDYLDGDGFDFDNADLGGEMIGALPGGFDANADPFDHHEKRKNSEDAEGDESQQAKRHEGQDGERVGKKPGRKPLTNEPTTKRKAQNRAAQRAFRERKEKHVKDLETKVAELTKSQEADKHENGMLKAQVERLQVELREYRKRLSLNSSGGSGNHSPPLQAQSQRNGAAGYGGSSAFSFDFPRFGSLPQSQNWKQNAASKRQSTSSTSQSTRSPSARISESQSPGALLHRNSSSNSLTPVHKNSPQIDQDHRGSLAETSFGNMANNNVYDLAGTLPQMGNADPLADLFSPSLLKSASVDGNNLFGVTGTSNPTFEPNSGGDSTAGFQRAFQFNSASSASASPSASSGSQWNAQATNSSCGTSPEPSHDSPANRDKVSDSVVDKRTHQQTDLLGQVQLPSETAFVDSANFTVPTSDTFDPTLFGGYRDNGLDNLFSNNDFSNTFFDESYNTLPFDMASPSNLFGILQSPKPAATTLQPESGTTTSTAPKPSDAYLANLEKTCNGGDDDYGLANLAPTTQPAQGLISCNNIWNQLQSNPDFQEGKFDLDGLCSELRAKAKCSESGVMVPQDHVDAALRKLASTDKEKPRKTPNLMFEQGSWDKVLQRLGNGST